METLTTSYFLFLHFLKIMAVIMTVMASTNMIMGMIMAVIAKIEEIKNDEPITHLITNVIEPEFANFALIMGMMELQV